MMQYVKKGGYIYLILIERTVITILTFFKVTGHKRGFPFLLRVELDLFFSQVYVSD